jgi:hypothetical protein
MSEADIDLGTNMDNVEDGKSSDIIPKGEYLVEISGARRSDKDGSSAIVVEFTVKGDSHGGKYMDSAFVEFMSLKETALWKVKALIKAALGQVPKGMSKFPTKEIVGKRIAVYTSIDTYEGRDSTRVQKFSPASKFSGGKSNSTPAAASASGDDVQV